MKFQDYYTTLGVPRSATADDIKRAYRKLAKEWHPDRHPPHRKKEVEERFKGIAEAHEVLSDPEKRKRYDALGEHWRHGQDFQPPPGGGFRTVSPEEFARMFGGAGMGGGRGAFSDFFTQMFGDMFGGAGPGAGRARGAGPGPRQHAGRGQDAEAEIEVDVGLALLGGKRTFALLVSTPCGTCDGEGQLDHGTCPMCGGLGSSRSERSVELAIPRLSRDGQVLRLRGLGEAGPAGPGDLLLKLRLQPDDTFRLRDEDVEADVVVAPWELLDGTGIDVQVPDGTAKARIPAGTKPGQRLRLRGQGLPKEGGGRGDLLLVVRVGLPDQLTDRQQELLRELGKDGGKVRGGAAH
ncbi:MAG: J domain-containing protein [Planctomycetes bacterium]|nr:J domain-containing protein [Planctomycetota bacterium]